MANADFCLNEGVELQDSHFLPKAIYKILRDDDEKNPNPWKLTPEAAVQTSKQITEYLLCSSCEQNLNKNGENWVLRHCLKSDSNFLIKEILDKKVADIIDPSDLSGTRIYYTLKIIEINIGALTYLASSVFWRGSIHAWNQDGTVPVPLGPYQERFRKYLNGEAAFPRHCFLWVLVRDGDKINCLTYAPIGQKKLTYWVYKFPIPGLAFFLFVGKCVPALYRNYCFVSGDSNPIIVTPDIEKHLLTDAVQMGLRGMARQQLAAGRKR